MNFKLALITSIIIFPLTLCGQKDYAIDIKGDTLRGAIKLMSYDQLDRLQINSNDKKTNYTALQVRTIFLSGTEYKTVRSEDGYRFMKVIKSGYLTLLAFRFPTPSSWDGRYLTKMDGSGMEVPNLGFKKILAKYLSECPEIQTRIENGDFGKSDLERVVDLFNICIQAKTETMANKPAPPVVDSEKILAIKNFVVKVEAENFLTKKDALDVLKDIQLKISRGEPIPNYLIEGLKSYLADTPSLTNDLEPVIALLKK